MKALVKPGPVPGLEMRDVPRPDVGPNDVLIAVTHAAICGTDLHIHDWDAWASENVVTPVVVGHEFVGTVAEIGGQVTNVDVGSRVAGEGHIVCGRCRNCRAGHRHLCNATVGVGIHRDGGFAEYVSIPATNVYPVPDSVPDEIAAILDPLGNAVHTVLSFDVVGEDVLITGAGPIGQMAAAICRHAGARHVVITDLVPARLAIAERMGASRAVRADQETLEDVMVELGMDEGFDVALEMSGSGRALADILRVTTHGAHVGLLGLFPEPATVDVNHAILKGLQIKGIYGREMFDTWYKAVSMLDSGLEIAPVISHRFALDDFAAAFDALHAGDATKVVLDIS
ncbi:L-threonine 3-dehydrogenase [Ilumatobacter sp.]|uniref:L-threonine 3-dehydrogenase n=1 Tax=Ilumatobacter sp. TaxID=1967498 RepID=UPI003C662017